MDKIIDAEGNEQGSPKFMAAKRRTWDDFNWNVYPEAYRRDLYSQTANTDTSYGELETHFILESVTEKDGILTFVPDTIHPNSKELLQLLYNIKPSSIFEVGCGPGHLLHNSRVILPDITIGGCDINKTQFITGREVLKVPENVLNVLIEKDFSVAEAYEGFPKYDFVFCHAVMMHLTYEKTERFLRNMCMLSNKWAYFIEVGHYHDFDQMIIDNVPPEFKVKSIRKSGLPSPSSTIMDAPDNKISSSMGTWQGVFVLLEKS